MLFFNDSIENINLKKIKDQHKSFRLKLQAGAVCSACLKPLTNEDSMIAGMGPTCLERTRFAESIDRQYLTEIEGQRESVSKGLMPTRTVLLKNKNDKNPYYMTILNVSYLESLGIDRTKMNEIYNKTGSMKEAISQALMSFVPVECEYVAQTATPKHPEVMRKFKTFQKTLRNILKERTVYLKENPYNSYYNQVQNKKNLSEEQNKERDSLLDKKIVEPDFFNLGWSKGYFHRATWIDRLNYTQLAEAKLLASTLKQKTMPSEYTIKDYGLTDQEIMTGLQHSGQVFEKNLFKSFLEGNKNLFFLIEMYKKIDAFEGREKLLAIRSSAQIANNTSLKKEDLHELGLLCQKNKVSLSLLKV